MSRKPDIILDVTNDVCPVPLIKTRKALDTMKEGEILEIIGADEAAKVDIIMAVKELGSELIKLVTDKNGRWRMLVRKK